MSTTLALVAASLGAASAFAPGAMLPATASEFAPIIALCFTRENRRIFEAASKHWILEWLTPFEQVKMEWGQYVAGGGGELSLAVQTGSNLGAAGSNASAKFRSRSGMV